MARESKYNKYLNSNELKSASAINENEVSDAKTVKDMVEKMMAVQPASSTRKGVKIDLTGDAFTGELKETAENLTGQLLRMKSEVKDLKTSVFDATNSKANKQFSDSIGIADKTLTDAQWRVRWRPDS